MKKKSADIDEFDLVEQRRVRDHAQFLVAFGPVSQAGGYPYIHSTAFPDEPHALPQPGHQIAHGRARGVSSFVRRLDDLSIDRLGHKTDRHRIPVASGRLGLITDLQHLVRQPRIGLGIGAIALAEILQKLFFIGPNLFWLRKIDLTQINST